MSSIYLDNNATTPMLPQVWEAMRPFCGEIPGNAASSHHAGRRARQGLESARDKVAALLGADPGEVIFTSGATEGNNLALFGLAGDPPGRIAGSHIEHPCVIEPLAQLQKRGFDVDWLPVNGDGIAPCDETAQKFGPETRLVALMLANHETGALQPVSQLAKRLDGKARLHCDAAAATGKIAIDFHALGVSSLTISAHKFHGPKGVGALLVRRGVKLQPLFHGGHQQQSRRPGTEPVALAVGMATALDLAMGERERRFEHIVALRKVFLEHLRINAAPILVNGPETGGIPHTLNVSFPGCQADMLLMNLDLAGVCCSTGSACSSGSLLPSPVLQAMGVPEVRLRSAMRFSFSHLLTQQDMLEAAGRISEIVRRLRTYRTNT